MVLKAFGHWILIKPENRNDIRKEAVKKRSGIILADDKSKQGQPNIGTIYSIGDLVPKDRIYKVRDKVVFNEPHPDGIKDENGVGYIPVKHEQIMAIIYDD